jgi:hypothetical protein
VSRISSQTNQRQRTKENPLQLGNFGDLSLRYLKGTLGPLNQVGVNGYGGGTYNHWFQINLIEPGWIIVVKDGLRPNYIQTSMYDLNQVPILGLPIFQADSITDGKSLITEEIYFPYLGTTMSTQSDLYNTYSCLRLDRGDDRYYSLNSGSYLFCVSTTRNERLDYAVGLVFEFAAAEYLLALEDFSLFFQETTIDPATTVTFNSPITTNTNISDVAGKPNGFTENECAIDSGVTVTILNGSEWLIGSQQGSGAAATEDNFFILEFGNEQFLSTVHDHTLSEWKNAWESQHHPDDKFPEIFVALTNRP